MNKFKFLFIRLIIPLLIKQYWQLVPRRKRTLLVIKNDGIGDYIIFRNYLSCIKNSERYKDYDIYLLGNVAFKDLGEALDSNTVKSFFWFSDSFFLKWDLIKLLVSLQKVRPESIAYVNYSRSSTTDWFIKNIVAKNKYGFNGDTSNQTTIQKQTGNRYYTKLFTPEAAPMHEFFRNRDFIEQLTGENCQLLKPAFAHKFADVVPANRICIFLGGSNETKKWPVNKLISLSETLLKHYDFEIILTGGPADVDEAANVVNALADVSVINMVGKTSLVDLCQLIASSRLLFSNDSAALHIAVALNIPVVAVAKGELYGRFVPYPAEVTTRAHVLFPPNFIGRAEDYHHWSGSKVSDIEVNDVLRAITVMLDKQTVVVN